MKFKTYEELETKLENWVNFSEEGPYDLIGALHLLSALLRNIDKNHIEEDLVSLSDFFDEKEKEVLSLLLKNTSS